MKLGDIVEVLGGKRLPKGFMLQTVPNNHPYITVKDMMPYRTELTSSFQYVPSPLFSSISRYTVNTGDVIISIVGTIGRISQVGSSLNGASLTENCAKLIPKGKMILRQYLFYFLSSNLGQSRIRQGIVGSTQPKLPFYSIESIEIPLPSIDVQRHIVGTIGTIDDLIEKEQELLMKIESFEKKLFSAAFEQERKNHYRLSEVCDFVPGYSYTSDELVDSPMGMVTIKSVDRAGGFKAEGIKSLLPESSLKSEKMCQVGDVLVAHTDLTKNQEIIGSPIIVATTGGFHSLTFSMDMVKVEPKNHLFSRPLIYQILKSQSFKAHALGYCNGSTVIHLSKGALANYEFDGPMASDIVDINGKLSDTYKVKISIVNKLEKLAESKRILLERYF